MSTPEPTTTTSPESGVPNVAALPATQRGERARTALFLTLTSFQFQVMR